jgi:hypothetical protein
MDKTTAGQRHAHQAAGLPLGRLRGADDAPLRVVQLPWLGQLALAADRRVDAPQVRQRAGIRQPVEHLQQGMWLLSFNAWNDTAPMA